MADKKSSKQTAVILVVDDDPSQRSLLESFLSRQGFEILAVSSGERTLEILDKEDVDLIVSDVRMPGMSGLEMLRKVGKTHCSPTWLFPGRRIVTHLPDATARPASNRARHECRFGPRFCLHSLRHNSSSTCSSKG